MQALPAPQVSSVQGFPSSQLVEPAQKPFVHFSSVVHELPSSHLLPLSGVALQVSAASSQLARLHWSPTAEQSRATPAAHAPAALHLSLTVQNCPSSQGLLTGSFASQVLVASLQLSLQLASPSAPGQGLPVPVHTPAAQLSVEVQKRPSLQGVPVWLVQVPAVAGLALQVTQPVATPP